MDFVPFLVDSVTAVDSGKKAMEHLRLMGQESLDSSAAHANVSTTPVTTQTNDQSRVLAGPIVDLRTYLQMPSCLFSLDEATWSSSLFSAWGL